MRHVDFEFLNQFARGEMSAEGALHRLLGLVAERCPECRTALGLLAGEVDAVADRSSGERVPAIPVFDVAGLRAALPDPRYVGALDKLEAEASAWARRVRAEKKRARADLRLLSRLPAEERAERIRTARSRFRSRAFAELLLNEARRLCRTDPGEAAQLCDLVEVALLWLPGAEGQSWARALRLRALAWRANALRVAGDLRGADRLFAALREEVAQRPIEDTAVQAEEASLEASLRYDQRRWGEARELLRQADGLYRVERDVEEIAKVAIQRGLVEQHSGHSAEAVSHYREALTRVEAESEPHLFLCAVSNLALVFCDGGRFRDAERLLAEHEPVYRRHLDGWSQPLEGWLRGRIAAGLGRRREAEAAFLAAREQYVKAGDGLEAALISFDLADLYVEQGRTAELQGVAAVMQDLFAAQGLTDRALAALTLFQQAVAAETVTLAAIRSWRQQVERAGRTPSEDRVA